MNVSRKSTSHVPSKQAVVEGYLTAALLVDQAGSESRFVKHSRLLPLRAEMLFAIIVGIDGRETLSLTSKPSNQDKNQAPSKIEQH